MPTILDQLCVHLNQRTAEKLLREYGKEACQKQLDWLPRRIRLARTAGRTVHRPDAMLVRAITQAWPQPAPTKTRRLHKIVVATITGKLMVMFNRLAPNDHWYTPTETSRLRLGAVLDRLDQCPQFILDEKGVTISFVFWDGPPKYKNPDKETKE